MEQFEVSSTEKAIIEAYRLRKAKEEAALLKPEEPGFDIDKIRIGMSEEDRKAAWAEMARVLQNR